MDPQDLNEFRSVEELTSHQKDVQGRLADLNQEYQGLPFPDEARNEFAGLTSTNDEINRRVKELAARQKVVEDLGNEGPRVERFDDRSFGQQTQKQRDIYDLDDPRYRQLSRDQATMLYRDNAMRAIETASFPHVGGKTDDEIRSHVERLLTTTQQSQPGEVARHLLATGSVVYRRAFWKAALAGNTNGLSSEEQRALTTGATTGGQAVPFTLDPTVIPTSNSVVNPARAIGRNVTISGSNTWNGVSSGAITAARAAEAAVTTDNTPTMAAPTATVTKAQAFVPFSIEIQEDWGALEAEMGKLFQDAKDDEEATAFVTGAGTTVNPQGFVTGTTATSAACFGSDGDGRERVRPRGCASAEVPSEPVVRREPWYLQRDPWHRHRRRCGPVAVHLAGSRHPDADSG
jgi:hypothetical protein